MMDVDIEMRIPKSPRIKVADSMLLAKTGAKVAKRIRHRVRDQKRDSRGRSLRHLRKSWPNRPLIVPAVGSKRFPKPRGGIKAGQFRVFPGGYYQYVQGLGRGTVRRYSLTGGMWRAMQVKVGLVFGVPIVRIGFRGSVAQRPRQDYIAQLAAKQRGSYMHRRKRKKAEGGGHAYERRELSERQRRQSPRAAGPASKAAYQKIQGGKLDFFLRLSGDELGEFAADSLRHIAEQFKRKWPTETLSTR